MITAVSNLKNNPSFKRTNKEKPWTKREIADAKKYKQAIGKTWEKILYKTTLKKLNESIWKDIGIGERVMLDVVSLGFTEIICTGYAKHIANPRTAKRHVERVARLITTMA